MMLRLVLVLACGCRQLLGFDTPLPVASDATIGDGNDGSVVCFGSGLLRPCFATMPTELLVLDGTIDTATDARCQDPPQPGDPTPCVIVAATVTINNVQAFGSRPLVIVAASITVESSLDVSSSSLAPGAGACTAAGPLAEGGFAVDNGISLGAGGAGGTFQGRGGRGGNALGTRLATSGGIAPSGMLLTEVLGGCPGGVGGHGPGNASQPGGGGGVAYLIAGDEIVVAGTINASGAGAGATGSKAGGSGGGAGGLIVLDAPNVRVASTGRMIAAGGGGAGGGTESIGGNSGGAPNVAAGSAATVTALGGSAALDAGAGANGSSVTTPDGPNASAGSRASGGGGGGGAGFIVVPTTANIAPGSIIVPVPMS